MTRIAHKTHVTHSYIAQHTHTHVGSRCTTVANRWLMSPSKRFVHFVQMNTQPNHEHYALILVQELSCWQRGGRNVGTAPAGLFAS